MNVLKLGSLAVAVAAFGVGCASSGYARYDGDNTDMDRGVGVSAGAEVGTDADVDVDVDTNDRFDTDLDQSTGSSSSVSALSSTALTDPVLQTKWMFDQNVRFKAIETYTLAVTDPGLEVGASANLPEFSATMPPGSVFVEAAGGAGETRVGRVIEHSPNPR